MGIDLCTGLEEGGYGGGPTGPGLGHWGLVDDFTKRHNLPKYSEGGFNKYKNGRSARATHFLDYRDFVSTNINIKMRDVAKSVHSCKITLSEFEVILPFEFEAPQKAFDEGKTPADYGWDQAYFDSWLPPSESDNWWIKHWLGTPWKQVYILSAPALHREVSGFLSLVQSGQIRDKSPSKKARSGFNLDSVIGAANQLHSVLNVAVKYRVALIYSG